MPDLRLRHFLTGKDDATIGNVTFLSRPAEWHAVAVGFIAGLSGSKELIVMLCMYLLGRETGQFSEVPDNLHVKDAMREPAYALGGLLLGGVTHGLVWGLPKWAASVV
jgi:hypothetical protein